MSGMVGILESIYVARATLSSWDIRTSACSTGKWSHPPESNRRPTVYECVKQKSSSKKGNNQAPFLIVVGITSKTLVLKHPQNTYFRSLKTEMVSVQCERGKRL
jgi:hypothetical protein